MEKNSKNSLQVTCFLADLCARRGINNSFFNVENMEINVLHHSDLLSYNYMQLSIGNLLFMILWGNFFDGHFRGVFAWIWDTLKETFRKIIDQ
jgi:hypothetical protein